MSPVVSGQPQGARCVGDVSPLLIMFTNLERKREMPTAISNDRVDSKFNEKWGQALR